nr:uncharacterized protein LOC128689364 [Cherax quadricarinatus]XP_053633531.1 uncharacterized protein LOC128689364 [Cherax quadricarinatus]XP_053633532.1 uncharacterized protein LOC128689364 [Cherax quadricarinatus]XP_053633534.1 uncharacterized protein LOC128689364 [Cherax quadricarinatus]XP_053633535.1 uncharacterized protein LOC128689364 [Cherax quadricarinatus]
MAGTVARAGRVWTSLKLHRFVSTTAPLSVRGIPRVLRGLGTAEEDVEDISIDDLEEMSNLDAEALQHHSSQLEVDAKKYQVHLRRETIKRKYFSDYEPKEKNLLTWAMKEQLRYLHSSDPSMWTPEALSKAFPISPAGAKKLLKVHWSPRSDAEIQKHDKQVAVRWKHLAKDQLGSAQLLKQISDNKRYMETQLAPTLGSDQILSTLQSLRFHDEEKPYSAMALKPRHKLPKVPKMNGSFSSIIRDYELQVSQLNKNLEEDPNDADPTNQSRCMDLTTIIPGTPKYEGTYTQVTCPANHKPKEKFKSRRKIMTFSEFIKNKTV